MQTPGLETTLYLSPFEIGPELMPAEETQTETAIESPERLNFLTSFRERIASNRKVVDIREDISNCDNMTKTVLSGAGVVGLFATGPLKLGTVVPLAASMDVLQTSRPGMGGLAAGLVAGFAGGATYGVVVRGGTQVIKNGVEHFPRAFGVKEENATDLTQGTPDQLKGCHGILANASLGIKCNMMSSPLMLAEATQGRSKKELTRFSNRLSLAGAAVMIAASTAVAETVVVSGHPELAQEIQNKIHDPRYLGSLTLLLLAIDGINYLRKNGLSSIHSKWTNRHQPNLVANTQAETIKTE